MTDNEKRKPDATAFAVIKREKKDEWIRLGPVWRNKDGSLGFTMQTEPIAWKAPACPRKVVIQFPDERGDSRRDSDRGDW